MKINRSTLARARWYDWVALPGLVFLVLYTTGVVDGFAWSVVGAVSIFAMLFAVAFRAIDHRAQARLRESGRTPDSS